MRGFSEGGSDYFSPGRVYRGRDSGLCYPEGDGLFWSKRGRDSEWGVAVDSPFEDGADGVVYNLILGVNVGDKVEAKGLHCDVEICTRCFSSEEREMILSDAMARLKMADKPLHAHQYR